MNFLRPADLLDSAHIVRTLARINPPREDGAWEYRRLSTIKVKSRQPEPEDDRPWFCGAFTREELWFLSYDEIRRRLKGRGAG